MVRMVVLGIPVSDWSLGSTRTRYYYMLKNLPGGWTYKPYKKGLEGDVLYIQKTETKSVWKAVKDCKKRGIPIVYERDDFCNPWNKEHTKIMNTADAVTVITESQRKTVQKHTKTPVYHVFDGIDYNIKPDDRVEIRPEFKRIVTYGRHANIEESEPYLKCSRLKAFYICDRPAIKTGKHIEWKLKKFISKLKKFDVIIIVHADNSRKKHKDIGRALVGMAMGIPTIVTPCIEHTRVYKEVGYPWLVVKRPDKLRSVIKRLRSIETRKEVSDAFYDYAWKYWRPEQSSARMAEVFQKVIDGKNIH